MTSVVDTAVDSAEETCDLVRRARLRDEGAFEALYRARVGALAAYVGSLMRDRAATEDVVAETFVSAWRKLDRLEQDDRFDAWLFRIAHNHAIDQLRKRRAVPLEGVPEPVDRDPWASPSEAYERQARAAEVREALLELAPDHREVLVLRFFGDLSHAEVARQLGKSEQATRALQYRAIGALRAKLVEPEELLQAS